MYKEEIMPYKRIVDNEAGKKNFSKSFFSLTSILFLICAFFASRVMILKMFMPFGIAFFIAAYGVVGRRAGIITGIVVAAGYLFSFTEYLAVGHAVTVIMLMGISLLIKERNNVAVFKISIFAFIINFSIGMFTYYEFISGAFLPYDMIVCFFESSIMVGAGFIFSYGAPVCFRKKKREETTREDYICIALMIAVGVAGTFDIAYMGLSFKNILAFTLSILCGFTAGPALGSAIGITLGLVSGATDASMPMVIGTFGFCGLISGLFRDFGKLLSAIAFVLSAGILSFYTMTVQSTPTLLLDAAVGGVVFMLIPIKKLRKINIFSEAAEEDLVSKKEDIYNQRVSDIMNSKVKKISSTLEGLSEVLEQNITNELSKKSEIDGMVEQLAQKVCFTCENRNKCWDSEFHHTSGCFVDMLSLTESKGRISMNDIPNSLKQKCLRPHELSRQSNSIFEIFRLNNTWRKKLVNSRTVLADQIRGVSKLVEEMVQESSESLEFKTDIEKKIEDVFLERGLDYKDLFVIKNLRGRYEIVVYKEFDGLYSSEEKEYIDAVSSILNKKMVSTRKNCNINGSNVCQLKITEGESYTVKTAIAKASRDKISGDSYTFGEVGFGRYLIGLSDGMGSGTVASGESEATVNLLEKFMEAGFEREVAIKAINSVLILRDNEERFATIDMGLLDLYSGMAEFVKIGSSPTFIKTDDNVEVIKSSSIPVGILDNIDFETHIVEIKSGDMIVMVSDGVADANKKLKDDWVLRELKNYKSGNPKDVADHLLEKAKKYIGKEEGDDMTIIVSKVWKIA